MWLTRLTSHLPKAPRFAGCLVSQCGSVSLSHQSTSACYSTQQPSKSVAPPQRWYAMDPELEEILVPRRMSISPLESWLAIRYSLPRSEALNTHEEHQEPTRSYECPSHQYAEDISDRREEGGSMQCKNVLKIRRRKMNKHKYKKLQKRTKFLRRRINDGRRRRRQNKFEKDLKRIWKKAGLEKAPEGWQTPKIFVKH
ncbi:small ribosomal subunit protein mS38 [Ascaphus truei]|uniref:small ribosomal subunit protein mS38 n=1 Tax=Ascaphus truei TaxID=8439 RepID=UPI003F59F1EE